MRRIVPFLLLLTLACATASSSRPATLPQPDIDSRLVTPIYFGAGIEAPATIEVSVRNRAQVPIIVRRIEITAPNMRQYTFLPAARTFRETVPPGETKLLIVSTRVTEPLRDTPDEPLSLRVVVELEAEGNTWREVLMKRN